eukprot:Ihof_evm2s459 gene=Ihof_evmTU2s459
MEEKNGESRRDRDKHIEREREGYRYRREEDRSRDRERERQRERGEERGKESDMYRKRERYRERDREDEKNGRRERERVRDIERERPGHDRERGSHLNEGRGNKEDKTENGKTSSGHVVSTKRAEQPRHPAEDMIEYGKGQQGGDGSDEEEVTEKVKPNFETTGKLAETQNQYQGVILKYAEPDEARKPKRHWKLFVFKGEQVLDPLSIHRQSCYLLGRERKVADIPLDHPSCSKQHAAIQYRQVQYTKDTGMTGRRT